MTTASDYRAAVFADRFLDRIPDLSQSATRIRQGISELTGESLGDLKHRQYHLGTDYTMLRFMLGLETVEWGYFGCRVGYFPATFVETLSRPAWWDTVDGLGPTPSDRLGIRAGSDVPLTPFEFGEALQESDESLDDREYERLRLLYFAPTYEWQSRLEQLQDLATHLEADPSSSLGPSVMDRLAWGLGEEPFSGIARTPSRWRFEWTLQAAPTNDIPRTLTGSYLATLASRVAALALVRGRIESVARDLGADRVAVETAKLAKSLAALNESPRAGGLVTVQDQDPLASKDNSSDIPPAASGRTVRQDTEHKYRQAGGDDYNPPGRI